MKKHFVLLLFCAAVTMSCQKNATTTYTPDCSGPEKSFSTDVFPVFQSSCFACHSNFSNYSQISADRSNIRSMIADGLMPQQGSLSNTQKNNILCWIDSGAPNN